MEIDCYRMVQEDGEKRQVAGNSISLNPEAPQAIGGGSSRQQSLLECERIGKAAEKRI